MCGIAGVLNRHQSAPSKDILYDMIGSLRHRGPDGIGIKLSGSAGLAHARLSIIDLAGGAQPMHNEDSSLWITFNGEIFNYLELREHLISRGHQFATQSDTEVILHLYEEMGEECVHRLNGQWAFAIWDSKNRSLFLSRDRLGVRPLFYTQTNQAFVFASEVKAIFAHPEVNRELDLEALDQIFTYWCTIPPLTAFKNVFELPPGHSMKVRGSDIAIRPYWEPEYDSAPNCVDPTKERAYADQLLDLLVDATRIRLRSDVPVGAYLSGGLDSTLTTALIKKFTNTRLRTFSVSFADEEFDESRFQREAVAFLDTDHQEIRCTSEEIGEAFPDVVWHMEKPVLRTAPAPLFLLSKLVRQSNYKVVVTGEGSDEMLGGYDIFKESKIRRFWALHPDSKFRPLLLRRLYPYLQNIQNQSDAYRRAFFHIETDADTEWCFSHIPRWELTSRLKAFLSPEVRDSIVSGANYNAVQNNVSARYSSFNDFCRAQYLEAKYLLPGYILSSQGDRVAMAHSVEGRFPFLDYRVVEFASKLPVNLKMKALTEKYLLKRCADGLIPASVQARKKQPYRAPEGSSFLTSRARDYVDDLLSPEQLRRYGLFDVPAVSRLLTKFRKGSALGVKDNMGLVGIISTQLLAHHFIHHFALKGRNNETRTAPVCN